MTQRSGSFPFMNLAQDFAVDYGDVLLLADGMRAMIRAETQPPGRIAQFVAAWEHVQEALIGPEPLSAFLSRMVELIL